MKKYLVSSVLIFSLILSSFLLAENLKIKTQYQTQNISGEIVIGKILNEKTKNSQSRIGTISKQFINWNQIGGIDYVSKLATADSFIAKGTIFDLIPLKDLAAEKKKKADKSKKTKANSTENEKENKQKQKSITFKKKSKGLLTQAVDAIIARIKLKNGEFNPEDPITIYYDSEGEPFLFIDNEKIYIPKVAAEELIASGNAVAYSGSIEELDFEDAKIIYYDSEGRQFIIAANGDKVYYDNEGEQFIIAANGDKVYYDNEGRQFIIAANGDKVYYDTNGELYLIDAAGITYHIPPELSDLILNGDAIIYYDSDGEPYIAVDGEKIYITTETATYLAESGLATFYTTNTQSFDSAASDITTFTSRSEEFDTNPISSGSGSGSSNTGTGSGAGSGSGSGNTGTGSGAGSGSGNTGTGSGAGSGSGSGNTGTGSGSGSTAAEEKEKIVASQRLVACTTSPNFNNLSVTVKSRTEISYTDGTKKILPCSTTSQFPIIKNFDRCSIRHDFHAKKSYKQAEFFFYDDDGEKNTLKNCSDTSVFYTHHNIKAECSSFFDESTRTLYQQLKTFINNEGSIKFITDCFISALNPRVLPLSQELRETQRGEKVNFSEKKAYQTYRKYFLIDGDFHYTSEAIVDEDNFYPITKEYGACNYEHRPTDNISYKLFRWAYRKEGGNPISVSKCAIDESLNYAHITDTLFCIPVYINQRIFERQQTYFRDNNDSIVVVAPCSPTQRELAQDPAKIVKDFSGCLPMIDYHNMRVTPQYKDTYPIGGNFVIVSDCKQSTSFYPLTTTAESCPANIDFTQKIVTPTVRFTYSDGDDTFFVGECQQVSGQTTLVLNEETAGCVMRLNADRKLLKVYAQKFYINQDGESVNVGGCEFNGETKELTPYFVKDYSVCAMTVNSDFTVGSRNFKQLLQIPNGPIHTIQNCRPDTAQTVNLLKDFTACAPNIDIATNSVTLRAKIYYVDENGDEQIFNNCATTQEQITLIKDYGNCNPNQKFINGKVHRYYQYKYTKYTSSSDENAESVYPFNQCSLEATGSSNLIDDFTCIDGEFDKIIDAGGKPQINAKGNRNNLSFTTYAEEGYALINAKKIFKDNSQKWQVAEPCSPRIEYGSFIITGHFTGYEFYDNLKHQKAKYQDHFTANMERVFEKATQINTGITGVLPEALSYELGGMSAEIDVAIDDERIKDFPIPYVFLVSANFDNLSSASSYGSKTQLSLKNIVEYKTKSNSATGDCHFVEPKTPNIDFPAIPLPEITKPFLATNGKTYKTEITYVRGNIIDDVVYCNYTITKPKRGEYSRVDIINIDTTQKQQTKFLNKITKYAVKTYQVEIFQRNDN